MQINITKRSLFRYILVVFLILVLFLFSYFYYLKDRKITAMKASIAELMDIQQDYAKIDSAMYFLYQAESNSCLYALTADRRYLDHFSTQIQKVPSLINAVHDYSESFAEKQNFEGLEEKKKAQNNNYLKIRELTDRLVIGFVKLGLIEKKDESKILFPVMVKKPLTTIIVKKPAPPPIIKLDTIKHDAPPPKKFFGRLADAISGKAKPDSSVTIIKTQIDKEVGDDTITEQVVSYNEKQLKRIRNYYKDLYANSQKAKSNENAILKLNNKLIAEIITVLNDYKLNEIDYFNQNKARLEGNLQTELLGMDRIAFINGLLLFSLIVVIFFTMVKLLNNELVLVGLNKRASQDVHSKSRFLANMSHEIRTPLNSIVGFSEQLSKGDLNSTQKDQVVAIRSSSEMLLSVVNEILDFSKFEVGKINFEKNPFSPKAEIMEVFNSMRVLAEQKEIDLKIKLTLEKDLLLMGDRFRLKQVIMNLLTNAIKFTSRGTVLLKVQYSTDPKKQGLLKVQVEDSGIGMAKEDMDLIFDEFAQVYSPAKTEQQGTGLGLAICKKIVESQDGKISVSSTLGRGSVFSFEIPYEIALKPTEEVVSQEVSNTGKLEGKRVLLVDDNKMNVLLAQTLLKKWKMVYDSAYDGKEALDLFKKNEYDIVLTDIQMPIMGGVELTHEIRYNGDIEKSGIPILGITAHVLQENKDVYLKAGMNDVVLKPFLEQELLDQICKYI